LIKTKKQSFRMRVLSDMGELDEAEAHLRKLVAYSLITTSYVFRRTRLGGAQ
jgi:hypothetical protein